jgi:hypothetical protein
MTNWVRTLLWMMWLAGVGWFWHAGTIGGPAALAAVLLSLAVWMMLPGAFHRRRRSGLQYVEMVKQPVGLL